MTTDSAPSNELSTAIQVSDTDIISPEQENYPWLPMEGEPEFWYNRFRNYFLPQGPGRSLLEASTRMVIAEHPEVAEARKLSEKKAHTSVYSWHQKAREWNWIARARAFDKFSYSRATAVVELARVTLLENSNNAAIALVEALKNDRLKVAAAKEILDRAGLPGTTNIGLGPIEKFTADELHEAEEDVKRWENLMNKPSEESG